MNPLFSSSYRWLFQLGLALLPWLHSFVHSCVLFCPCNLLYCFDVIKLNPLRNTFVLEFSFSSSSMLGLSNQVAFVSVQIANSDLFTLAACAIAGGRDHVTGKMI